LDAAGLDRRRLAELNARAYLEQVLHHGFFHADPHPGNIAVDPDGSLIFYDFGMMGRLHPQTKEKLVQTLMCIVDRDADGVIEALVQLKALVPQGDMGPVRRSLQYVLDHLLDKPLEMQSISAISEDLYALAYDQPFRFPATFTFVMRAFSTLEGLGRGLDANFQFFHIATPYALEMMEQRNHSNDLWGELGRQAAKMSHSALSLPRRVEETLTKLERGDLVLRSRSLETERLLRRLIAQQAAGNYHVLTGSFLIAGAVLLVGGYGWLALLAGVLAGFTGWRGWRVWQRHERLERLFE